MTAAGFVLIVVGSILFGVVADRTTKESTRPEVFAAAVVVVGIVAFLCGIAIKLYQVMP